MGELNDLPDHILEHILGHVGDVKSLVRTGLISRRWKKLWKEAPVPPVVKLCSGLLYHYNSKRYPHAVREAVASVLSRRRVGLEINLEYYKEEKERDTFTSVIGYCVRISRCSPEAISISHSGREGLDCYDFCRLAINLVCRYSVILESLRTLRLERTLIDDEYLEGFDLITRLELVECQITRDPDDYGLPPPNALAFLPSLKHLKLVDCQSWSLPLKVTAPQLLTLEIGMSGPEVGFRGGPRRGICPKLQLARVSAPRLQSFRFSRRVRDLSSLLLGELSLPCLYRATVRLIWVDPIDQLGVLGRAFRDVLLLSLRNARSLHLCFELENNHHLQQQQQDLKPQWTQQLNFPRTLLKSLIKSQASPFTKLKTLTIQYPPAHDPVMR